MRAELSNLIKQYDGLSQSQRANSDVGGKMLRDIQSLTNNLSLAEEETGRFQRMVGNYPQVVTAVIPGFDKLNGFLGTMGSSISDLASKGGAGLASLGQSAISMGKAFITPPVGIIVAILSAILLIIDKVKEAFGKNEEATLRMQKAFAILQPVITLIGKLFDELAIVISKVVEYIAGTIQGVARLAEFLGLLPKGFGDAAVAAQNLVQSQHDLDDAENAYTVNSAERNNQIATLRDQAIQKDKYSAEQRKQFLTDAMNLEKQNSLDQKNLAEQRFKINDQEAKQNNDTSDAQKKKNAELRAAMTQADTDYYTNTRRMQSQLQSQQAEIDNEAKQRAAEAKKAAEQAASDAKERYQKQLDAVRKAQDTALALVMEGVEKQRQTINNTANREIEDLKHKLATEKNLTQVAREAMNQTILNIEAKRVQDLDKLSEEEIKNQIDREANRIELKLAGVAKEGEEAHNLRMQQIAINQQAELEANRQLAEDKRQSEADINAKYDRQREEETARNDAAIFDKQKSAMDLEYKQRLSDIREGSIAESQIKLEQAQNEYDQLIQMDEKTKRALFASEDDYTNAVLDAKIKLRKADENNKKVQMEAVATQLGAYATIADGMSQALESFAGDNEQLAEFAKAMALFNIALSTGEAIAKGIAAAQDVPFPGNLAAIATTIATVLTNIAKANQLLNKQKQPKAPKFAEGGLITGAGSGTSDSITANVSAGESILTAQATNFFSPLLSAFNQIGGGVPITSNSTVINNTGGTEMGKAMLKDAFSEALREMPPQILSIQELTRVQNQIQVMERLSKTQ
jgi:hypothetical protein